MLQSTKTQQLSLQIKICENSFAKLAAFTA